MRKCCCVVCCLLLVFVPRQILEEQTRWWRKESRTGKYGSRVRMKGPLNGHLTERPARVRYIHQHVVALSAAHTVLYHNQSRQQTYGPRRFCITEAKKTTNDIYCNRYFRQQNQERYSRPYTVSSSTLHVARSLHSSAQRKSSSEPNNTVLTILLCCSKTL